MRVLLCAEYALVSLGSCQSNNRFEVLEADCDAAAVALGLSDTSATAEIDFDYPSGCYQYRDGSLYFNRAPSTVRCGTDGDNCICGAAGTGSVFTFTVIPHCFHTAYLSY